MFLSIKPNYGYHDNLKSLRKLFKKFQEFLLNTIHGLVHGVAHTGTNLMHNIFGKEKRDANEALSAKEEVNYELEMKRNLQP